MKAEKFNMQAFWSLTPWYLPGWKASLKAKTFMSWRKISLGRHITASFQLPLQEAHIGKVHFAYHPLQRFFPSIGNSVNHFFFLLTSVTISYMTTKPLLALFLEMFHIHRTANIGLTLISFETINSLRCFFSISLNKLVSNVVRLV